MKWVSLVISFGLLCFYCARPVQAEFNPYLGGYNQNSYGSFSPNPFGTGYSPYGQGYYPGLQMPPQQQMFLRFLSNAKASLYKPRLKPISLEQSTEQLNQSVRTSMENFSKSVASGQEAFGKNIPLIPEIQLGESLISALSSKDRPLSKDPLAGLSEQIRIMNEQAMKAVQAAAAFRAVTNVPVAPVPQRNVALRISTQQRNVEQPIRGLASMSQYPLHRSMHSPLGHAVHGEREDSQAVRVIPYQ